MRITPERIAQLWRVWQAASASVMLAAVLLFTTRGVPIPDHCKLCPFEPWPDLCWILNWCWW